MTSLAQSNDLQDAYPELQAFTDKRDRPSLFLFSSEALCLQHAWEIRSLLNDKSLPELDLVIQSGGGSIHVAYIIVKLLRSHVKKLNACVPLFARSAATLLCIGADEIFLDEMAQLGPLDPQYDRRANDSVEKRRTSPLDLFQSLEALKNFAHNSFEEISDSLMKSDDVPPDICLDQAAKFASSMTDALFSKFSPEQLGAFQRELSVSMRYATQILRRWGKFGNDAQIQQFAKHLVYDYPSHDYIIDFHELQDIGLGAQVHLFTDTEQEVVEPLAELGSRCSRPLIEYREPQGYPQQIGFQTPQEENENSHSSVAATV